MGRPLTIVVNPAAGRGKTSRLLPDLGRALAASDLDYDLRVSTHPGEPVELARRAFDDGRAVVACGGDGLVGQLAGVAADAGGVFGVIPTGSGNDFARHLGLDHKHPLAAVDVLATGEERAVDLGRVDGRWFCCVLSAGFDAEANRWANTVTRIGGTTLYVAATLRTLAVYRPLRFAVTVDGERHEHAAWLVAVGNAPSYGGGMRVTPGARTDDGLLHVTVVGPVSRFEFLRTFPKVFSGTHVGHPEVHVDAGRTVTIEPVDDGDLPAFADGEPAGVLPVTAEAVPEAVRVIAPAPAPSPSPSP